MEALEAIYTRRSIRKYTSQPVSEEMIHELLTAAMHAPSAGNEQPWHFIVIRERQTLDAISVFHPHGKMLKHAPIAILVCGESSLEKYKGRWVLDCSAATQNILLAAHAKGLGAVWVGIYPEPARIEGMRKSVIMPDCIIPHSLIPLGYPAEHVPQPQRFNASRVHYENW